MAFLIIGAVQLIGFTSSGIAARSTAAAMMSAAGPVAAGSVVAICQSIGATGAVSFTTALVANTTFGGAVGGAVVAAVRRYRRRRRGENDGDDTSDDGDSNDGDDNDVEGGGDNHSDDKVVSSGANTGEGTKVCNLDKHAHNIDEDASAIDDPNDGNEADSVNESDNHIGSKNNNTQILLRFNGNKSYRAKVFNSGRPNRHNSDDDNNCGVRGPSSDDQADGDYIEFSDHISVRDHIGVSNHIGVRDYDGVGNQIAVSDPNNDNESDNNNDGDEVDFGELVYNSDNELYDPTTGEAVVEI